jgi:hypothetical protein
MDGRPRAFQGNEPGPQQEAVVRYFFMKKDLDVSWSGSLVLLQLGGMEVIGIDFATSKRLWEIRL